MFVILLPQEEWPPPRPSRLGWPPWRRPCETLVAEGQFLLICPHPEQLKHLTGTKERKGHNLLSSSHTTGCFVCFKF